MESPQSLSVLQAALERRDPELSAITTSLVSKATPLLWHSLATFPAGTSHTPSHTSTVEAIAGMLIPDSMIQQLNDVELQLLILACHFHDLGMAGTDSQNESLDTREQARKEHAVAIGERIINSWRELGFPDLVSAQLLAEVCRGHRPLKLEGHASWEQIRRIGIASPGKSVRLRVVAALIYAADELHIGADRAPEREFEWLQIQDEESMRHWRRHQAIQGPVLTASKLLFEVRPTSPVAEEDIRKAVLVKALDAVKSASLELARNEITEKMRSIDIEWIRSSVWQLLLLEVQCDAVPRSVSDICDEIERRYEIFQRTRTDLSLHCTDLKVPHEFIRKEIARTVEDYVLQQYLVKRDCDTGAAVYVLTTCTKACQGFFSLLRAADEWDVLMEGRYAKHHEFDFFRSSFGAQFNANMLHAAVSQTFGVDLHNEESAVATVVQLSPTAAQLVTQFPPAPSILVKRHLLRLSAMAGASLDILRMPELLLNSEFRRSLKAISKAVEVEHPPFMHFVEELILIDGYSPNELSEELVESDESRLAVEESFYPVNGKKSGEEVRFTLRQSIPSAISPVAVSFPYLVLAGRRSGVTVELLNTIEAPISLSDFSGIHGPSTDEEFVKIAVGPATTSSFVTQVSFRAMAIVDEVGRYVEMRVSPNSPAVDRDYPILLYLTPTSHDGEALKTLRLTLAFDKASICVGQLRDIDKVRALGKGGPVTVSLMVPKSSESISQLSPHEASTWGVGGVDTAMIETLASIDAGLPYPWFCTQETEDIINSNDENAIRSLIEELGGVLIAEKPEVSSLSLQFLGVGGQVYREEFLGMFPGLTYGPPTVEDPETQELINEKWRADDEEITMAASYSDEMYKIATHLLKWASDPTKPFPLNITSDPPLSPVFRTRVQIVRMPAKDRVWYVERPLTIRLQPISNEEKWTVEAAYWKAKGDERRVSILADRLQLVAIEQEAE